jgi:hypothetical protein
MCVECVSAGAAALAFLNHYKSHLKGWTVATWGFCLALFLRRP